MSDPQAAGAPATGAPATGADGPDLQAGRSARYGNEAIAPYFFLVIFCAALIAVGYVILPFLGDMITALLTVVLLAPLHERISRSLGNRPVLASGLTVAGLLVVGGIAMTLVASALIDDIRAVAASWSGPAAYATLNDLTSEHGRMARLLADVSRATGLAISPEAVQDTLVDAARNMSQGLYTRANAFLSGMLQTALHALITLFSTFYLFIHGTKLRAFLFALSPLTDDEDQMFITKLGEVGRAVLVGNGIGSALQGLVAGIAWAVVGLPSPVLWGLLMAIAAFLPLVGVAAVVVPASLYLWVAGRHVAAICFFAFCMGQSFLFEYGLKPRLMGSSMRMNSLLVFLSLLGGILGFGIPGILYGPLIMTLFLALAQLYLTRYQQRIARRLAAVMPPEDKSADKTAR